MKNITESINESKQTKYNVAFIPSKGMQDGFIPATILVDSDNVKRFEEFAEKEQDNIFASIEGGKFEEI